MLDDQNMAVDQPVVLMGAGGHARVVLETLRAIGADVIGVVSPELDRGGYWNGVEVLGGDDEFIEHYQSDDLMLANGIGSLPKDDGKRRQLSDRMRGAGFQFVSIVHPSAEVSGDVLIKEGVQVMAGVVIQPGVVLGGDVIANTGAIIEHDCRIGDYCHISPGAVLCGGVTLKQEVHLGAGAVVIQGVEIGQASVVAAGATVYKNIPKEVVCKMSYEMDTSSP